MERRGKAANHNFVVTGLTKSIAASQERRQSLTQSASFSAVIARRKRAIQYPRDGGDSLRGRSVLDRPVEPGDDR
jgi:hypothetical protein